MLMRGASVSNANASIDLSIITVFQNTFTGLYTK